MKTLADQQTVSGQTFVLLVIFGSEETNIFTFYSAVHWKKKTVLQYHVHIVLYRQ